MFNVVNREMIVEKYGADTLRMYEMLLGPVEQSKPCDTNGIDGVHPVSYTHLPSRRHLYGEHVLGVWLGTDDVCNIIG